jgi:hypothetical protein
MLRRITCAGIFVFALVGLPGLANAGIIEFIWKMSGPQFIGAGLGCTFNPDFALHNCRLGGTAALEIERQRASDQRARGPYLFLGGEAQFSTGLNDADGSDYKVGQIWRAAVTPGVSYRAWEVRGRPIYVGAGLSWDLLFGKDFSAFDKFAISVVPAEVLLAPKHALAFKLRIYPNAYTSDEFGFGPRQDYNRPWEVAWGFSYSYLFKNE